MAITARFKCVVLFLSLLFNGYEYAEIKGDQWRISNNELGVQDTIGAIKQNGKSLEQPLDLESIFGKDWESENKPIEEDKLKSILIDIFGSKGVKEIESSTQSSFKPNQIASQSNSRNETKQLSETDVNQNGKVPWEGTRNTPTGENNYDSTFNTQTAFPFEVFNGEYMPDGQGGAMPINSIYRPQSTSSPIVTTSFEHKQTDVYGTTTPSYWFGTKGNLNSTITWTTVASDVNSTTPSFKIDDHNGVSSTTSSFISEKVEAKPTIPSHRYNPVNPASPILWDGNQKSTIPYPSFNPGYQSTMSSTIPSILNPMRPTYRPEIPIKPNFRDRYHNFRPHYWPYRYSAEHYRHGFRPHNYHYPRNHYHQNGPRYNFQHMYSKKWSNSQNKDGRDLIDIRFGADDRQIINHDHGGWAGLMTHHNHHQHHYYPRFHHHHGGLILRQ